MQPTLLVLAAGMGSRFGGLKQIEEVGPSGEMILDYSVFDAMQAGFDRVVFVIRRDIAEAFEASIGSRFSDKIKVDYVFQEMDDLPEAYSMPEGRAKPWGTGHAVLAARHLIDTPFAVINADDFYGAQSYRQLSEFLQKPKGCAGIARYALAGFPLRNTLSEHGYVSRGVCTCNEEGFLESIEECTHIEKKADGAVQIREDGSTREFTGEERVSMNMWAFMPELFGQLETLFSAFLAENGDSEKAEFYLPSAIDDLLKTGKACCEVLATDSHWAGMTYREDLVMLKTFLSNASKDGTYNTPLW
jgi:dTDP-glucose pyrophosphorylase